jgi:hypothetical protein
VVGCWLLVVVVVVVGCWLLVVGCWLLVVGSQVFSQIDKLTERQQVSNRFIHLQIHHDTCNGKLLHENQITTKIRSAEISPSLNINNEDQMKRSNN